MQVLIDMIIIPAAQQSGGGGYIVSLSLSLVQFVAVAAGVDRLEYLVLT